MVGQVGFDLGIMQVFQKHKVSYTLRQPMPTVFPWWYGQSTERRANK
jgi:hypothetical protein